MRSLIMTIAVLLGFVVNAQQINTYLSQGKVLVGQPDTLTIQITSPIEAVLLPEFQDPLSAELEVLFVGKVDSTFSDLGYQFTQQIYITSFDTGSFLIPFVTFHVKDSTIQSRSMSVGVVGAKVDLSSNIHGIQDIEDEPITMQEVLVVIGKVMGFLVAALLIIWVARWYYNKYKLNKKLKDDVVPEIPFMDTFWPNLVKIEEAKYWQKGEVKEFHSLVTALMRSYLEHRFKINAMEQTSDEILTQLQILVGDKMLFAKIEQTLLFADMVKFAKATGVQGQHEKAIENLKELVALTELKSTTDNE
ncbi:MAG: hypothetical protein ACJA0Q_001048 [Saprospiraceae bacterium]|jgi:hypothetical protein